MPAVSLLPATLVFGPLLLAGASSSREAPSYSEASIVNSADFQGSLAPNSIGTIYGVRLAYATRALASDDISGGILPTTLAGTGTRVLIGGLAANVYYISPTQINFLVPSKLLPGPVDVQVTLDGLAGPAVVINLAPAAPALFMLDGETVIATRLDGSLLTQDAPAHPGEFVTVYATGLGETVPPAQYGRVAAAAAQLKQLAAFQVLLDGVAVDPTRVYYAGLAPGFAGLYQINIKLPDEISENPELRIAMCDAISRPGLKIPARSW